MLTSILFMNLIFLIKRVDKIVWINGGVWLNFPACRLSVVVITHMLLGLLTSLAVPSGQVKASGHVRPTDGMTLPFPMNFFCHLIEVKFVVSKPRKVRILWTWSLYETTEALVPTVKYLACIPMLLIGIGWCR